MAMYCDNICTIERTVTWDQGLMQYLHDLIVNKLFPCCRLLESLAHHAKPHLVVFPHSVHTFPEHILFYNRPNFSKDEICPTHVDNFFQHIQREEKDIHFY